MSDVSPHLHERDPDVVASVRRELVDARAWLDRTVLLVYAGLAGLAVVAFTWLSEAATELFMRGYDAAPWAVLVVTPALTVAIVGLTRRWAAAAAGSGIPQVMAALAADLTPAQRQRLVSLRLAAAKVVLASAGLLGGLSLGREGPSVQVAAGVLHHARRWLRRGSALDEHALLVAGGAAGIAAAFNAPLAGVVFAIEELSRRLESRASGLIIAAIVLAGLVAVSVWGNYTYFGSIRVPELDASALLPGLVTAVVSGLAGGLLARVLVASLQGGPDAISRWRARHPVRFAALAGLGVAVVGLASDFHYLITPCQPKHRHAPHRLHHHSVQHRQRSPLFRCRPHDLLPPGRHGRTRRSGACGLDGTH